MANSSGEWIEWSGGECPVALDALVLTRRWADRPGGEMYEDERPEPAGWWRGDGDIGTNNWLCDEADGRIIAYRVVPA